MLEFGHGEGRTALERVWTRERYDAITRILASVPIAWRFLVKHQIFGALAAQGEAAPAGAAAVYEACRAAVGRHGDLPAVDETPTALRLVA